jgi:peptidylprolyl isomerase
MEKRTIIVLVLSAVAIAAAAIFSTGKDSGTANVSKTLSERPKISKPSGTPPTSLVSKDIVVGSGAEAKDGDKLSMRYEGVAWSTGTEFDASWNRPENSFEFQLGAGNVIPCWDQGIVGMKVGGRRQLTCPPSIAYGEQGQPPSIGPNETLIFVVDLTKIS